MEIWLVFVGHVMAAWIGMYLGSRTGKRRIEELEHEREQLKKQMDRDTKKIGRFLAEISELKGDISDLEKLIDDSILVQREDMQHRHKEELKDKYFNELLRYEDIYPNGGGRPR